MIGEEENDIQKLFLGEDAEESNSEEQEQQHQEQGQGDEGSEGAGEGSEGTEGSEGAEGQGSDGEGDASGEQNVFDYSQLGIAGVTNQLEYEALGVGKVIEDYSKIKGEYEVLSKKLQQKNNPFANDEIGEFNNYVKDGGEANYQLFQEIKSFDASKAGLIDAIVMRKIISNPKFASRKQELRDDLEKKYGVNREKWEEQDDEYKPSASEFDLEEDAALSMRVIKEEQAKIKPFESQEEDLSEAAKQHKELQEKRAELWGANVNKLKGIKAFRVNREAGEKAISIPNDDGFKKWIDSKAGEIQQIAVSQGWEPNAEGVKNFMQLTENLYVIENLNTILENRDKVVEANLRRKWDAESNGAPPLDTDSGSKGGKGTGDKSPLDIIVEQYMK